MALEHFLSAFETVEKQRDRDRIHPLRKSAVARLAEMGLPHAKQEEWRFTDIAPIRDAAFPLAEASTNGISEVEAIDGEWAARLVLVDGYYRKDLSTIGTLPEGVKVGGLADALDEESEIVLAHLGKYAHKDERPFVALNTAFLADGTFVYLPKNAVVELPIQIVHVSTGNKSSFPRHLFVAKDGSQAKIVESFVSSGEDAGFVDTVAEVVVGANANLDHTTLQLENDEALHVHAIQVLQGRDSNYANHKITLGGKLTRNDVDSVLDAENICCTLNGLYHTHGNQHVDNHTRLEHRQPHCESHELYKGILDDRSSGVFSGKIHVFEDAQKTDAKQSNANLLLTDTAVVDTKPQLEIYADDVKCTHGAVVGQLDANALFYLRSRGIPGELARNMLIRAFASDVAHRIPVEAVREKVDAILTERLPGGRMDQ
ncbi:MAG: Fe-S cluster assembly protein SufD [Planctomycetota bacterium]|jgi:Fe-S cluster assembly protein SufD